MKSSIKPPPPPAALEVDNRNYHELIKSGKDVLVAFTAPWVSWVDGVVYGLKSAFGLGADGTWVWFGLVVRTL